VGHGGRVPGVGEEDVEESRAGDLDSLDPIALAISIAAFVE
jgi:hypothetical protein